eukprot:8234443-Ditylum_brightwellii.AAC.1
MEKKLRHREKNKQDSENQDDISENDDRKAKAPKQVKKLVRMQMMKTNMMKIITTLQKKNQKNYDIQDESKEQDPGTRVMNDNIEQQSAYVKIPE